MILIDANILIYAYDRGSPFHEPARQWLEGVMERREPLALSWHVVLAFLRIMSNPLAFRAGLSLAEICDVVGEWLGRSHVTLVQPSAAHWEILQRLVLAGQATRDLVADAHLAALAIEHGATLCTTDRDFSRFPGLKLLDPIARK